MTIEVKSHFKFLLSHQNIILISKSNYLKYLYPNTYFYSKHLK